jgi:hypothetical protein
MGMLYLRELDNNFLQDSRSSYHYLGKFNLVDIYRNQKLIWLQFLKMY